LYKLTAIRVAVDIDNWKIADTSQLTVW